MVPKARLDIGRARFEFDATQEQFVKAWRLGQKFPCVLPRRPDIFFGMLCSLAMNAVRLDRGPNGQLRAWVSAAWDRIRLRKCADLVQDDFGGEARDRVGGADLVFWDFMVSSTLITVHLEHNVGIAIMANDTLPASEALVRKIAEHVLSRNVL